MANSDYCVFGLGLGPDDLCYIGWTRRSVVEEKDQICGDLVKGSCNGMAHWFASAIECGSISIFEIESAPSMEEAKDCADSLRQYFRSLGLELKPES